MSGGQRGGWRTGEDEKGADRHEHGATSHPGKDLEAPACIGDGADLNAVVVHEDVLNIVDCQGADQLPVIHRAGVDSQSRRELSP